MPGIPSLGGGGETFDEQDTYVPEHLPEPGPFLRGADVLTGDDHVRVHRIAREVFEERGVYDVTFGYNLAKLNRDARHEDAGLRYAREDGSDGEDEEFGAVLRAEFTPTTEFCPQGDSLAVGIFRAFNGESDAHEFDLVRVRVDEMHQDSTAVNEELAHHEEVYRESGEIPGADGVGSTTGRTDTAGGGFSAPF